MPSGDQFPRLRKLQILALGYAGVRSQRYDAKHLASTQEIPSSVYSSHRDHGLVRKRSHAGYGCIRAVVGGKRRCQLQTLPTDANVFSVLELLDLPPMIPSPKTFRRQKEYPNGISYETFGQTKTWKLFFLRLLLSSSFFFFFFFVFFFFISPFASQGITLQCQRPYTRISKAEERRNGFQVRKVVHKMPDPDIKQALVKPGANFADARPRMPRMARKS